MSAQETENQIGGANLEASRVTPEQIADLLYRESDEARTLWDLVFGAAAIFASALVVVIVVLWFFI